MVPPPKTPRKNPGGRVIEREPWGALGADNGWRFGFPHLRFPGLPDGNTLKPASTPPTDRVRPFV